jgi:hypothetical protein
MIPLASAGPAVIVVVVVGALALLWVLLRDEAKEEAEDEAEEEADRDL